MSVEGERIITQGVIEVMGSDWAQLHEDLLIDIFKRMKCVEDMTSISCVCCSWKAISRMVKPKWSPSVPLFIVPSHILKLPSCKWTFYDPSTRKRCVMDFPPTTAGCFPCCVDGWIFVIEVSIGIHLFNPFTKDSISLPPINTMPKEMSGWNFYNYREVEVGSRDCSHRSVIKVKIPLKNELYVFAIIHLCWLIFAKHEDSRWSYVECVHEHQGKRIFLEDMIYHNGQIVILYGDGKMVGLDLDHLITDKKVVVVEEYVAGDVDGNTSIYGVGDLTNMYLFESCSDILLALWYGSSFKGFEVMKYDPKEKAWMRVEDIGDVSLFVSKHSAMAVCASNAVSCQPNYIYYTGESYCPPTIRVFPLHNKQVEETFYYPCTTNSTIAVPFWFMPNFKAC